MLKGGASGCVSVVVSRKLGRLWRSAPCLSVSSGVWNPAFGSLFLLKNTALKRYLAACCWPCCPNLGGGFRESPFLPQIRVSSERDSVFRQQGAIVLYKMGVLR